MPSRWVGIPGHSMSGRRAELEEKLCVRQQQYCIRIWGNSQGLTESRIQNKPSAFSGLRDVRGVAGRARSYPQINSLFCEFCGNFRARESDPHGHDYIAVAERLIAFGTDLSGGLFVLQLEAYRAIGNRGEKIQKVLRVKSDGDGIAFVRLLDGLHGFAVLRALGGKFHALGGYGKFHGARALVGKLRDAANRVVQFVTIHHHKFIVVAWHHRRVIGELAGKNSRDEATRTHLEKQVAVIAREINYALFARFRGKPLDFRQRFLGHQHAHFVIESREVVIDFGQRQPVPVGGHHRGAIGLQQHQAAIQRVPRLLRGNSEYRARNQAGKNLRRDFGQRVWRLRDGREIVFRHSDHLVGPPSGLNLHPVVLKNLELDFLVGQQAHQLEQLLRRNGAAAFLLDFGLTGSAYAEFEIGGGQKKFVALALNEKVGENGDSGLALDDALRQFELLQQVILLDAEFHRLDSFALLGGGSAHGDYNLL